jgi:hypothetical protein
MKKILLLQILLIVVFCCSCNNLDVSSHNKLNDSSKNSSYSPKNSIIGKWKHNSWTFTINVDGSCMKTDDTLLEGKWKLIDNQKLIFMWNNGNTDTHTILKMQEDLIIIKYNGVLEYTWVRIS